MYALTREFRCIIYFPVWSNFTLFVSNLFDIHLVMKIKFKIFCNHIAYYMPYYLDVYMSAVFFVLFPFLPFITPNISFKGPWVLSAHYSLQTSEKCMYCRVVLSLKYFLYFRVHFYISHLLQWITWQLFPNSSYEKLNVTLWLHTNLTDLLHGAESFLRG
jgi:hypothetical protein